MGETTFTSELETRHSNWPRLIVALCFSIVVGLCAAMAFTSGFNRHPDEVHHFQAVAYYATHFLPPEIGDLSVRDSYSVWGISYLNYSWIEYLILGKVYAAIMLLISDHALSARIANLLLLVNLGFWFIFRSNKDAAALIFPSVLLISPQVWYVFSYVNNDAFALVISLLLAYQIASPTSATYSFFHMQRPAYRRGLWLGLLIGLQLICKSNYWPMLGFAAGWVLIHNRLNRVFVRKLGLVFLIAIFVLGLRIGADLYVNGESNFAGVSYLRYIFGESGEMDSKLRSYQEEIADPPFRPSALSGDLSNTDPGIKLRDKGVSLIQLFSQWKWHEFSFCSFVGVYGYMDVWAPKPYYGIMALLYFTFCCYVFWKTLFSRDSRRVFDAVAALAGITLTISISLAVSWTYSFQPQGRYLFPCIPMMAVFIYTNRECFRRQVLRSFALSMFLLSVYSFVFVGLARLR